MLLIFMILDFLTLDFRTLNIVPLYVYIIIVKYCISMDILYKHVELIHFLFIEQFYLLLYRL